MADLAVNTAASGNNAAAIQSLDDRVTAELASKLDSSALAPAIAPLATAAALATCYTCSMGGTHSFSRLHARRGPVTRRPAFVRPLQRIKPSALSLSAQALRGLYISASWLVKWLSQALDATHAEWGDSFVPDFILPCIPNLSRPMSDLQALVCLRWARQLPWKSEGGQLVTQHEASSFTLHSQKCALQQRSYAFLKTAEGFRDTIASRPHCCTAGTTP